jgi:pimeloyl-ACP methyl ester carboxylesterase
MRLADPLALHRSACGLIRGTEPTMRAMLTGLGIPRTYLVGEVGDGIDDLDGLAAAGVRVVRVPDSGHCIMFDNPRAYAAAISAAA